MNKIFAPFIGIGSLLLAAFILAEVVAPVAEFFAWFYLTKQELESALSTGQVVAVDTLTHVITYTAVGALFSWGELYYQVQHPEKIKRLILNLVL